MNEPGRAKLTEGEHRVLKVMAKALPKMSDYRKGYLEGYGDAMSDKKGQGKTDRPAFAEEK